MCDHVQPDGKLSAWRNNTTPIQVAFPSPMTRCATAYIAAASNSIFAQKDPSHCAEFIYLVGAFAELLKPTPEEHQSGDLSNLKAAASSPANPASHSHGEQPVRGGLMADYISSKH
jgi:hypothetical protein